MRLKRGFSFGLVKEEFGNEGVWGLTMGEWEEVEVLGVGLRWGTGPQRHVQGGAKKGVGRQEMQD